MTEHSLNEQTGAVGGPGHARNGAAWTFAALALTRLATWSVTILAARELGAATVGLCLVCLVAYAGLGTMRDQSVSAAVVVGPDDIPARNTLFAFSMVGSLVVAAGFVVAAPLLESWTGVEARPLCIALAVAFGISGLGGVSAGMITRKLGFAVLSVIETTSVVTGSLCSVLLLFVLRDPVALGYGQIVGAVVGALAILLRAGYRPGWRTAWRRTAHVLGYQTSTLAFAAATLAFVNVDTLAVAMTVGGERLGQYAVAFNVTFALAMTVAMVVQRVAFPSFTASVRAGRDIPPLAERALRSVGGVMLPASAALFIAGPVVLPVVFGDEFDGSGGLIRILVAYGILWALTSPAVSAHRAQGSVGPVVLVLLVQLAVAGALLFLLVPAWGAVGAALAVTLAAAVGMVLLYSRLSGPAAPGLLTLWQALAPLGPGTAVLVVVSALALTTSGAAVLLLLALLAPLAFAVVARSTLRDLFTQ